MSNLNGTFILSTVGTSLLAHARKELSVTGLPSRQQVLAMIRKAGPADRSAGAEINSCEQLLNGLRLRNAETRPPFTLSFLVSETEDGRWTGEFLESYYKSVRGLQDVDWRVVEGLCPDDPDRFARVGLRSLVRMSADLLRQVERRQYLRIINATGGFKAQISFAGLIGQTLGVPVIYQFETFAQCIEMPPMPVDFDRWMWLTNYDAFMKLAEAGALADSEFPFQELDPVIRDLLDSVEDSGARLYSLSPILELMHHGFLIRRPRSIAEPAPMGGSPADKISLVKSEIPHDPKGTEKFVRALVNKFPWIVEIKNHTPRMNTARTHLLPSKGDLATQSVCFSDGEKGVRLSVRTTSEHEGHVEYVTEKLAEFLHEW
jgi:putative CRISPR-associated protein (TIGR02619 family)